MRLMLLYSYKCLSAWQILTPTEERRKEETEGVRGKRRTAGRKEEGMNEGANGAGRHWASFLGAGQPAERRKHPPTNTTRMARPALEPSIQWEAQGRARAIAVYRQIYFTLMLIPVSLSRPLTIFLSLVNFLARSVKSACCETESRFFKTMLLGKHNMLLFESVIYASPCILLRALNHCSRHTSL